jgi:23S rRNA pseudouridine2605 synthase
MVAGSRAERPAAAPGPDEAKGERIAKVMARAGLCSRREAERWIAEGRVVVDGARIGTPVVLVGPGTRVEVDGKPLPAADATRLWRYHKSAALLTTDRDPRGRRTIFDELPSELPRVVTVGRLDYNSEGLLLLTNDGALARHLELPATGWKRRYRVRVHGTPDEGRLAALAGGVTVSGMRYGPIEARIDKLQGANAWLTMTLTEGRNREVRRVCEHLDLEVARLIRTAYGPFQLGNLARGAVDEVAGRVLRQQLGARFAPTGRARRRR